MSSSASFSYLDDNLNFNPLLSQNPPHAINEQQELLRHPYVADLYRQYQMLLASQTKLQEAHSKLAEVQSKSAEQSYVLQNKNVALQSQVLALESELTASKKKKILYLPSFKAFECELLSLIQLVFFSSLTSQSTFQSSPATSIYPSDSISQARAGSQVSISQARLGSHIALLPNLLIQPAIRPPQYPFEVIWNLEDCKEDPEVKLQESNKSRPSMDRAVRHPDGSTITDSEWSAIKVSARRIVNELSQLPDSNRQAKMRKTKSFYRSQHPKEWTNAIARLEAEQPLLRLCSSNWKADHVLGNAIQANLSRESNASKGKHNKNLKKQKVNAKGKGKGKFSNNDNDDGGTFNGSDDGGSDGDPTLPTNEGPSGTNSMSVLSQIVTLYDFFSGDMVSHRMESPPPQSSIDISMESPTMSTASSMKRPGPSSPQGKRSAKKHRGEQDSRWVASQVNWMAPLTASTPGAKAMAISLSTNTPQDTFAFIHVESSCMYCYPYEM